MTLKRRKPRGDLSPSRSILKDKVDDKGLLESLRPDLLYSNFEEEQIHQGICFWQVVVFGRQKLICRQ
jgi:hypothetical protein